MAVATRRYDKTQLIIIDDKEIRLIDHIKNLRIEKKITKKKISNLVKHNDYWYSQVERNGKNGDDNRQRTIYRPDLIKIISAVKYNALTPSEQELVAPKSENYIDKIIKVHAVDESLKYNEFYKTSTRRTPEQEDRLIQSLLKTQAKLIYQAFHSIRDDIDKNTVLDSIANINTCLKIDPVFIIHLFCLPFADFLYEAKQQDINILFSTFRQFLDEINIEPKHRSISQEQLFHAFKRCISDLPEQSSIYYSNIADSKWIDKHFGDIFDSEK